MATRSIPLPTEDAKSDSGITWPPEEKLELLWFEKSPPPEDVANNFRIVPLDEVGARPGMAEPESAELSSRAESDEAPAGERIEQFTSIDDVEDDILIGRRAPAEAASPRPEDQFEPVIAIQTAAAHP